ncbi:molybdenum cofactor cytidylyltransferase [Oxalobacteraceae bacterium GrIS 2.11]
MADPVSVGILLAAGRGQRFDPTGVRNKLTQVLDSGVAVAMQAAEKLRQVSGRLIVVVANAQMADQFIASGFNALVFPDAQCGMGASLAFAVSNVIAHEPHAHSVIVGLADMPFVQTNTIELIVEALQAGAEIVQPVYQQQAGHPVGFAKRHFPALMALTGDIGARHLLRKFPVVQISVDDPGIVQDIDYISDLHKGKP